MEYYKFCKKQFEYELRNMNQGRMEDITEEWLTEGNETWERIYKMTTKNKSVDIIIFSSLDMRTNHVRDNGADAVRIIIRWKTKSGFMYKRIGKNYRVKNLFRNLKSNLEQAHSQVFSLNFKEFTPSMV